MFTRAMTLQGNRAMQRTPIDSLIVIFLSLQTPKGRRGRHGTGLTRSSAAVSYCLTKSRLNVKLKNTYQHHDARVLIKHLIWVFIMHCFETMHNDPNKMFL